MEILLIRHGQAVEEAPGVGDAGRWLTAKGRKTTRIVGRWLDKRKKRRPGAIWTSPLVRAVQTAEIVAAEASFDGEVRACSELNPGRDPGDLIRLLEAYKGPGPVAVIGHEPSLSLLAAALLGGDPGLDGIKKSGVLGITWVEGNGQLRFILDASNGKKSRKGAEAAPPGPPVAIEAQGRKE